MRYWVKRLTAGAAALAMVIGANAAFAQEAAPAAQTSASPAMWRVSDADSDFILLGTFHILPKGIDWRSPALDAAMETADEVYFEVEADSASAQQKTVGIVMMQGFNKGGKTLSDMLKAADTQKLKEISASLGLPFDSIDAMRPWNAFLTLSVQFIVKQGYDPSAGVDSVLLAEARTRGKDLKFFETIEEQLGLFTGLSPETEKNLLLLTIRDWDEQAAMFDDLYKAWAAGDTDMIDEQMNTPMREDAPEVYERLMVARNKAWAEELDGALKNGSGKALIAVGAGHLVGSDSVQALLAAKGYDVAPYGADGEAPAAEASEETDAAADVILLEDAANDNEPAEEETDDIGALLEDMEDDD